MRIKQVQHPDAELVQQLVSVWESSVRATHHFLSDDEITAISYYVPQALTTVPHLVVARKENKENNEPVGFMGISGEHLEMLFISAESRGQGIGKVLLTYGIEKFHITTLSVNEQNPAARGFYEHMGFRVKRRSALDEQGNPYPVLYMKRDTAT